MAKEQTALMQAIAEIRKEAAQTTEPMSGNLMVLADSISELLPLEKEQIRDGFDEGQIYVISYDLDTNAEQAFETYYNENYGE